MSKFLYWLSGYLPYRSIDDGNVPYLERYYLFTVFGWRFYLHQFVGSDPDRGLHDHPWSKAYSVILSGWYWEETRSGARKVEWLNSLTGDTFHRVVLPIDWGSDDLLDRPCWTLFMHKAYSVKPWGFWRLIDADKAYADKPDRLKNAAFFEPYTYAREGSQKDWWLTAKRRGRP